MHSCSSHLNVIKTLFLDALVPNASSAHACSQERFPGARGSTPSRVLGASLQLPLGRRLWRVRGPRSPAAAGSQALRTVLPASRELISRFPQPAVHLIIHPTACSYVSWSDRRYVSSHTRGCASVLRPFLARPHSQAAALQSWLCNGKNCTEALRDHRYLQHLLSLNLKVPHDNEKCPSAPVQELLLLRSGGTGSPGAPQCRAARGQHVG